MNIPRQRASYDDISIYSPPIESWRIDLSDNTNLWGTPPAASAAMAALGKGVAARYPQPYSRDLRGLLACYAGVPTEMIVVGCGSDDIIDSAMRAFAEPGDSVCVPDPTFSMAAVYARMNGLDSVRVPLRPDLTVDVESMLGARARITYLCTPNNPTGKAMPFATAEEIVSKAPGLVIIDSAYAEFGGESMTPLAGSGRAVVTRTMSKAFGLAGLRIGYGIASPEIVRALEKARGPYKVNVFAEAAAIAALTDDFPWVLARIENMRENRERFARELRLLGYEPPSSDANFILVPVTSAADVVGKLAAAGIAVRGFPALAGIGDAIRITIGPWEMMQECLDALGESE